jgi:predicted nucleic acid-binding protein
MTVSNSGPLIHLAMIDRLDLLQALFGRVAIPYTVKIEAVDRGKEEGKADAFLVEGEIRNGWIVVEDCVEERAEDIAESAGIEAGEAEAILLARSKQCLVLLDDLAARRFAAGLGLEVTGSIGVLRAVKVGLISRSEGLDALEKLARIMWLSVGVYEDVRKVVEGLD